MGAWINRGHICLHVLPQHLISYAKKKSEQKKHNVDLTEQTSEQTQYNA